MEGASDGGQSFAYLVFVIEDFILSFLVDPMSSTGFSSQGRAKLHVFRGAIAGESIQLSPSLIKKPGS